MTHWPVVLPLLLLSLSPLNAQKGAKGPEPRAAKAEAPELDASLGPRVLVTAFRSPIDSFEHPRSIIVVDEEVLLRRSENSALDALDRSIGIWIEKRTASTSDPVLRGLSGANLLATVDGNSLSTFWGEGGFAGDDMYGKVEPESLERIEVIRGPASLQYASNALGGVINFVTRKPSLPFPEEGAVFGARFKSSFETINKGLSTRLDAETAIPGLRFRIGGTWRDMENGQGGHGVGTLDPSGGREYNFDLSAEYLTGVDGSHVFVEMQQVAKRGIARYYRKTQNNENDRTGFTAGWRSADRDAANMVQASFYYQWKQDRRYWNDGRWGYAHWQTYSSDFLLRSDEILPGSKLLLGATAHLDQGQSPDDEEFTVNYPDGRREKASPDADWYDFGFFVQSDSDIAEWATISLGLRYDYFMYQSRPDGFYSSPGGNNEIDRLDEDEHSLTGGVSLLLRASKEWRIGASWSRGFRYFAPKFGIVKTGFGLVVPSGLQDPVIADNFELTLKHRSEGIQSELAAYYTNFDGFQETQPGSYQGNDYYDYNGNNVFDSDERVYVTTGGGRALLYGVEWDARVDPWVYFPSLPEGLYLSGGLMWNYGRDLSANEPMRHTHPARGVLRLGYEEPTQGLWYAELEADFVRHFDRIPSSRLSSDLGYRREPQDPSSPLLREDGLPGYTVLKLQGGARVHEKARLGFSLDNLSNKNYRPAHSRMDAFGFSARFFFEIDL